jgi:tetratricopeptide (TPR) repeat protein
MGSIFGRDFSYSLLSAISGMTDENLQSALARLTDSGLVYAEGISTNTTYVFKHALVQEAAYASLLKSRRRELHRVAAKALNETFSELTKIRPELVAHHLTEAGEAEQAVEAWQIAGERASSRAALIEAGKHFARALEVLFTLPDSPDRAQLELPLQISIGHVVSAIKGFSSREETQAYARAKQIAEQLGDSPQFFFILLGLWSTSNTRSEINAAQEVADEMLRIAEGDKTPMHLVWACLTQGIQVYGRGDFSSVGQYYDKLIEQYNPEEYSWAPFDPAVSILTHTTLALWHRGLIEQSRQKSKEQMERGLNISVANEAMARLGVCSLNLYLREGDAMYENAKRILEIAEEHKMPSFIAWGTMYIGAALILQGKPEEGLPQMTKGIGEYLASGTHSSLGQYLCHMAEGYLQMGDLEQAMATIENAFGAAPEERMHFPELHRVRADILAKNPKCNLNEVENEYREAISVSQQFGSIMQELRAVTRLGRLLQSRGRSDEAHGLLAPLFQKFSEGFDTHDMREAKTLLDELSVNQSK